MPLAITSYLTETPSLRPVIYYATWGLYWLSYALSPGLVTVLQVLVMVLTGGLPWLERATARWRTRVASHEWASVRFRDEFVDPRAPPAEWPGWLKSTGSALDMRWVGSSVWESVSRFFKGIGGWFGGSGDATAAPAIPVPPAASVFSARPAAKHAATMPAFAPSAAGYSEHYKAPSVARSTSLRSVPLEAVSLRTRSYAPFSGGSQVPMEHAANPFSPRSASAEHDDDRGSVWSGSGWKKA